jgi:peptidoglycan hydrolase-like protein with peptidoglycan-binding domain
MGASVHQAIKAVSGSEKMDGGNDVPPYNEMGRATLTPLLWEVIAMKRFVAMLGISLLLASGFLPLNAEARGATSGLYEVRDRDLVRDVQRQLKAQGFYPGAIDGNFGSQTATALRAYQRSYRLPETARLDETTLRSLLPERSGVSPAPEVSRAPAPVVPRTPVDLSNREVRRDAQRQLKALGFDPGSTDGTFGPQTEAALRAYQQAYRLPQTGRPDEVTLRSLLPEKREGALR